MVQTEKYAEMANPAAPVAEAGDAEAAGTETVLKADGLAVAGAAVAAELSVAVVVAAVVVLVQGQHWAEIDDIPLDLGQDNEHQSTEKHTSKR